MRLNYPEEMDRELLSLMPYLMFNGERNVVKPDAPEGTEERYEKILEQRRQFKREHVGF